GGESIWLRSWFSFAWRTISKFIRQDRQEPVNFWVGLTQDSDAPDCVAHRRMIPAVVELPDLVMSENSIALKTRVLCGRVKGPLSQRSQASFGAVTFCYTRLRRER